MFRDVARSTSWRERLSYVVRGPGWANRHRAEVAAASSGGSDGQRVDEDSESGVLAEIA